MHGDFNISEPLSIHISETVENYYFFQNFSSVLMAKLIFNISYLFSLSPSLCFFFNKYNQLSGNFFYLPPFYFRKKKCMTCPIEFPIPKWVLESFSKTVKTQDLLIKFYVSFDMLDYSVLLTLYFSRFLFAGISLMIVVLERVFIYLFFSNCSVFTIQLQAN